MSYLVPTFNVRWYLWHAELCLYVFVYIIKNHIDDARIVKLLESNMNIPVALYVRGFTPATMDSKAMRTYIPYSACLKYAALGSESKSGEISSTRGSGCITTIRLRARVINWGVTTNKPRACKMKKTIIRNTYT